MEIVRLPLVVEEEVYDQGVRCQSSCRVGRVGRVFGRSYQECVFSCVCVFQSLCLIPLVVFCLPYLFYLLKNRDVCGVYVCLAVSDSYLVP